jgi:hypothetical protein
MKSLFKYGAVASIFLLTAGSAAFAQNYTPGGSSWNQGSDGSGWNQNQGSGGSSGWNQGAQGSNQGSQGWNQGGSQGWNQGGFSGGSQGQGQGQNEGPSQQDAYQELSKYGYNNVRNLQRSEGWEAHATKNGDRVHVFIDDDGMIATYRGD